MRERGEWIEKGWNSYIEEGIEGVSERHLNGGRGGKRKGGIDK